MTYLFIADSADSVLEKVDLFLKIISSTGIFGGFYVFLETVFKEWAMLSFL